VLQPPSAMRHCKGATRLATDAIALAWSAPGYRPYSARLGLPQYLFHGTIVHDLISVCCETIHYLCMISITRIHDTIVCS
jgi:hypothetical protein